MSTANRWPALTISRRSDARLMRPARLKRQRETLSILEARRLVLAAQGLDRRPAGPASLSATRRMTCQLGLLQIDSVNILVRAHYMPLFSRLGAYDRDALDADSYDFKRRRLFEYWAHEASLVPLEMHPLFRWRMEAAARGEGIYGGLARFAVERKAFVAEVLKAVRDGGPVAASDIGSSTKPAASWWSWSEAKTALEFLFWAGKVTTLRRETAGFARIYDVPERVLPASVLAMPAPGVEEAQRALLMHAAGALGVATEPCLREYFRLPVAGARARLAELVEAGELLPVAVQGWDKPGYMARDVVVPRKAEGVALLSPFDPLISERGRAERLFDFHYRIEIYTPAHKRKYGYYCLPLLMGDRIAGRFDLKADRAAGVLRVEAAHAEDHADAGEVAAAARAECERMAGWLGLTGGVEVKGRRGIAAIMQAT